ncbi:MAG: hypothetical protein METHP_01437 [Methanoregula sp. SKADARSKE-2]|nr:MAG: hypothetical protein METHP_01437 [Methanoregula sp. SKADARSKE-2]
MTFFFKKKNSRKTIIPRLVGIWRQQFQPSSLLIEETFRARTLRWRPLPLQKMKDHFRPVLLLFTGWRQQSFPIRGCSGPQAFLGLQLVRKIKKKLRPSRLKLCGPGISGGGPKPKKPGIHCRTGLRRGDEALKNFGKCFPEFYRKLRYNFFIPTLQKNLLNVEDPSGFIADTPFSQEGVKGAHQFFLQGPQVSKKDRKGSPAFPNGCHPWICCLLDQLNGSQRKGRSIRVHRKSASLCALLFSSPLCA